MFAKLERAPKKSSATASKARRAKQKASLTRKQGNLTAPDWRNLGLILRILLAALFMCAWVSMVSVPLSAWPQHMLSTIGYTVPPLFLVLLALFALSPWIQWLAWWQVAAVVVALAVLASQVFSFNRLEHALVAAGAAGLALIYLALRTRAFSPAIAEARLQALQARIRPHFLFNSLNGVLGLMRRDPRRAEHLLEDLAELIRAQMKENRDLKPLDEEVLLTKQYLALEDMRLGNRLKVKWVTQSMPPDALVPPLILQPLVENAVYHGIEPAEAEGELEINIFLRQGQVVMLIRNPYLTEGGSHHAGNKMAVGNIKERLKLHFDEEGRMESVVRGNHYEVRVFMPYRRLPRTIQGKLER